MGIFDIDSDKIQSAVIELERKLMNQLRFNLEQLYRFPHDSEAASIIWFLTKKFAEPFSETSDHKLKIVEIYGELVQFHRREWE